MDDGVGGAIERLRVLVALWVITAFADDPFLFANLHVSLEGSVVITNHALQGIIKTVADVVRASWNQAWTLDVVDDEGFALRTNALQHLCVEATVLLCAVGPVLVLVWQVVIEEIVARNELATIPFCDISTLKLDIGKHHRA